MIWLALIFIWFTLTVLRGAREQFAWGALWSVFVILGVVHVLNPDAYIARTNIRLMNEGRSFDAYYNANLSDDAVPVLLENLDEMSYQQRCTVEYKLRDRLRSAENEKDFRSWNWSRWSAQNSLHISVREKFFTTQCPGNTTGYDYHRGLD
jgi:hypothetical protein